MTTSASLRAAAANSAAALAILAFSADPARSQSSARDNDPVVLGALPAPAGPTPVVNVPGAAAPKLGPFDTSAGTPSYRPQLPGGTPEQQERRDPAQPVITLGEALQRTYWTNPQLLSERARTRSTDFLLPQARGEFGPQLQYSGTYGYQRNVFEQATGSPVERSGWTSSATAVLTQPLFTFGRLRANEDSARAQIAFRRSSLAAAEQQILLSAINAYAAVLRDRAGVAIAQSNADLLAREFSDTRTRLEARDSTIADVQQIQTRLELARAQLLAAQGATASSDALFLRFVGAPAGELAVPSQLAIPARTLEDAYAYADANNPVITSAYARERVSRAQLELSKADLLPRVDLRGQASISTLDPYSDSLRQTELRGGVTISGTLDTGIRTARIGEAAAANDADWRLIDDTIRENRAELAEAWNNWLSQTAASERLRLAVQAAESALQGALIQQRAGLRTTTEILELARDLLQVRSSLNSALATSFVQQARVLSAMGALKPELFMATDAAYDPTVHGANVADDADLPLLTGAIRELDSLTTPPRNDRPVRDPAVPLGTDSVAIDPAQP